MSRVRHRPRALLGRRVWIGAEIVIAYGRARWWLRRTNLPETVARLRAPRRGGQVPGPTPDSRHEASARSLAYAVNRGLPLLPVDSRCLMRSLVLTALLARRGIDGALVIGVRPGEDFGAHAWVEHAGRPLLPPGDTFAELVRM